MNQSETPVLDALLAYHEHAYTPFTPPGHKQGRGIDAHTMAVLGPAVFASDVLAVSGLDDRMSRGAVLDRAQQLMAEAVHAEHTFFSTCGSSLSVKSAMLAVAGPHEKLVISRDAHKSVVSGLILSGVRPIWVDPTWDPDLHLAHPPQPDAYAEAFTAHPDARGALVTSPTPYGTCADIAAIAQVCHRYSRPLIVDEAWGAHLPFHPALPTWAMDAGADVCVTSAHKMGGGLEQSSVFHHQGNLVDPDVLRARADLLGTTSPSALIYAALDGWRAHMAASGHALLDAALARAHHVRDAVEKVDGLRVNRAEFIAPGRAYDLDPLQVIIDISALGTTGYAITDWLRERHRINLHVADHRRISAQLTYADDDATTARLLDALRDVADQFGSTASKDTGIRIPDPQEMRLEQAQLPRDAFFARTRQLPAHETVGQVCAEMLTPYPPGIPAVLPGERLTAPIIEYLTSGVGAGMVVPDAVDPELGTIRVVDEEPND
ncbi:ornithine decarboxylase [Yinghuangia sp. ASG 101]|uniref:aminotransferase class I/II-fold pyridoxal phosphate-dependent enzyme n=1 Tax=Yinghuangia sp. ASG 101 TaxID=2896848 RepID=UPI001E3824B5|nr:ornithine decarboxylase [Yinghuangia sp. ASG 101]UGQ11295.1 ornithine decarboxylase [Yinghuangia sp. ASG 101]